MAELQPPTGEPDFDLMTSPTIFKRHFLRYDRQWWWKQHDHWCYIDGNDSHDYAMVSVFDALEEATIEPRKYILAEIREWIEEQLPDLMFAKLDEMEKASESKEQE